MDGIEREMRTRLNFWPNESKDCIDESHIAEYRSRDLKKHELPPPGRCKQGLRAQDATGQGCWDGG